MTLNFLHMHENLVVQLFKFHCHIQFMLVGICFFSCHSDLLNLGENINCIKCTELINIYKISPNSISTYAAKHFELPYYSFRAIFDMLIPTFVA